MNYFIRSLFILSIAISFDISASSDLIKKDRAYSTAEVFHQAVCAIQPYLSDDPWHIASLYNCASRELFVPYQLWSGASWGGDKRSSCMHNVQRRSILSQSSDKYAAGEVIVRGPVSWKDPHRGDTLQVWERAYTSINSYKYYACHKRGIGIVHNLSKPTEKYIRGLCRAPAGFGWKIGQRRTCVKTTIEIDEIVLDEKHHLVGLSYKYWFRDKLKFRYTLRPNLGETEIFLY